MKHRKLACIALTLLVGLCGVCGATSAAAADGTMVADPSFNLISGSQGDMAYFNDDGTVTVDGTATPGYGFRANASNLGAANLIDVKKFSTTIELTNVPVGVTTIFSLQELATGTITVGSAINIMFRRDSETQVAVAIYDKNASEPAFWAPGQLDLPEDKTVTIAYDYDSATAVTLTLAGSYALPADLISAKAFDDHYAATDYKGYYSISSYFMGAAPASTDVIYTIKQINGKTPLENYKDVLAAAVGAFETAVGALTENSSAEEIYAAGELDVFAEGAYATLLSLCDTDGAIAAKIEQVRAAYKEKSEVVIYEEIAAQIAGFAAALEDLDVNDETAVAAAIAAYEAIDRETMNSLSAQYKDKLNASLTALVQGETFRTIILAKAEAYVSSYEEAVAAGDAASLSTFKQLNAIVENWPAYKAENYLEISLTEEEIAAFDARIAAIDEKLSSSFYSALWTEGDTWEARKTDLGLYASGAGKYYETLGFNQKLELGKTSSVEFNIIYALRGLGKNHLHIGFYPEAGTGTKGSADGVRVDFWFSETGLIEIKPVNGRTEENIYDGAYLSVEDTGFFDVEAETPDYSKGRYTVALSEENGTLLLTVNGLEMELSGISPDLFADGCYMTVSAMSVEGADYNEILITKVGDTSYVKGEEGGTPPTDPDDGKEDGKGGCKGCSGAVGFAGFGGGAIVLAAAAGLIAFRNRKMKANKKQ